MSSLRARLARSFAAVLIVVGAVAAALLYRQVHDSLHDEFDFGLQAKAQALAALLELDGPVIEFDDALASMPEYAEGSVGEAFAIWGPDGELLTRSASLPALDALEPRALGTVAHNEPRSWDLTGPDDTRFRVLGLRARIGPDEDLPPVAVEQLPVVTVVAARDRGGLDAQLRGLLNGLWLALVGAVVLGGAGLAFGVRRGLRPVDDLGARVAAIDEASLSARVSDPRLPDELRPLAAKLDELLARLEAAFARQQRMTAAMAHELRTPIAELRAATDVARQWPDDTALGDEALDTAVDVAARMSAAVEAVMHACRVESGEDAVRREPVPVRPLVDALWAPLAPRAEERQLTLDNELPDDLAPTSDPHLLGLVLRNLLDNAASFSDPGRVRVHVGDDGELIVVENPTADLGPDDLEHLAEPFWRKDAARSDGAHSGLGLWLVRSVADALGLDVSFDWHGGNLRVGLRPAPPEGAPPP